MEFRYLIYEKNEDIAKITINRPEVRNALNKKTLEEIKRSICDAGEDSDIRVVIITGAGEKAFAAGADLNMLKERTMLETFEMGASGIFNEIHNLPKPVIAAVNGYALGGGCELALACDIRVAGENAKFGLPEVGLGVLPGAGGTQRLSLLVGIGKAKELIFTGAIIDAWEAEKIGLVNKVVPSEKLDAAVTEMAKAICRKGPLAIKMAKAAINADIVTDLNMGLAYERALQAILFATEDKKEGINAILEKRQPAFKGK